MANIKYSLAKFGGLITLITSAILGWSLYESRSPKVREYDLPVLPKGVDPITILHISDLHFRGKKSTWLKKWLSNIDLNNVDLIISTGDNLGAENVHEEVVQTLRPFLRIPGVFVFGSNDYYAPKAKNPLKYFFIKSPINMSNSGTVKPKMLNYEALRNDFKKAGWIDLNNNCDVLDLPQGRIEFIGVDDPHLGFDSFDYSDRRFSSDNYGCVDKDFQNDNYSVAKYDKNHISSKKSILRIGVAHAPYLHVIEEFEKRGCALSCFGHTHGGQLCLPLFGALVSNCDLPPVFASGLFSVKEIFSYVKEVFIGYGNKVLTDKVHEYKGFVSISAGLGASPMLPLRFACRPEISRITLVEGKS